MKRPADGVLALVASALAVYLAAQGAGPLPALGPAFNPVRGAWADALLARSPDADPVRLQGLRAPVDVYFEGNGVPHIAAGDELDLFRVQGYLHARFRLTQMDLMRRQGAGRLSEVVGRAALDSDRFELQLGLLRTARLEWSQAGPETRRIVLAYTDGVNQLMAQERASGRLPMLFRLLGYEPRPWEPVDTYVIKGLETQELDFQDAPLAYQLLVSGLGHDLAMRWFPVLPPNEQHPYDSTPHRADPPAPIPAQPPASAAADEAAAELLARFAALPPGAIAAGGNSNNWAVDGSRTTTGRPLLAGDPHLSTTLPPIWYQVDALSPGFSFRGVGIPGTPGIVIGRNDHIAWSLTNTQNQATFYYLEKTDAAHPDQYLWNGEWRRFQAVRYDIPVKGGPVEHLEVRLSVHGPQITRDHATYSVYWLGNLPSPDIDVLIRIARARDFEQFRAALRDWHAPSQNFVYADDAGHIGLVSAGYYPILRAPEPWLPMPGTGEYDVIGTVPFDQVPQVYDPPEHFTFSANQREVPAAYPYYIGTTLDDFDAGYRADEIHRVLSDTPRMDVAAMEALQNDDRDYLAARLVPKLLDALDSASLSPTETAAKTQLRSWNHRMDTGSAAASIWWMFLEDYLQETFRPWFDARHVRVPVDRVSTSLVEDLEAWTLNDPGNEAFTPPGAAHRDAPSVMRAAFRRAAGELAKQLGGDPAKWAWGRLHAREIPSLAQIRALGYGPSPAPGDRFTPNAAGGLVARAGPSWRMVADLSTPGGFGIVPGGQSENPASAWYDDRVPLWWDGRYQPLLTADQAQAANGGRWRLRP